MIKKTKWIFLLIMIFGALGGYAKASKHDEDFALHSARDAQIFELNQTLKECRSQKKRYEKESNKLVKKIVREKRKSRGESSRKLDTLLRRSQRLVSNLESLSEQIAGIEGQLKQQYTTAIAGLVSRIEKGPKEKKKNSLMKQLFSYIEASEELEKPIQFQIPEVDLEIQANDTSFEIQKKADFLSGQTRLLKARMYQIDARIAKLEQKKVLRDKVKKFADEISFFDDTQFVEERKITKSEPDSPEHQEGVPSGDNNEAPTDRGEELPPPSPTFDESESPTHEGMSPFILPPLFTSQKEVSDSSPSDLILSGGNIDYQINLLKQQKDQLGNQVQLLWGKTQIFYKRAEELSP